MDTEAMKLMHALYSKYLYGHDRQVPHLDACEDRIISSFNHALAPPSGISSFILPCSSNQTSGRLLLNERYNLDSSGSMRHELVTSQ